MSMASLPKMPSTSNQEEATSSCRSPTRRIHDVFLSFRGKDTRLNFTAHLYSALKQTGISAYLDDRELERGSSIGPTLWKAIEESRFSIIVFSKNYASSSWCLDELVKIIQCKEEKGHIPLPVFYDVDHSEVANQTENYGKAFVEHKQEFRGSPEKVSWWKDSLTKVANLSGWDVRNRNEQEVIEEIVQRISYELNCLFPISSKGLVGIESRIEQLNGLLEEGPNDIGFIGISGMGGLGKTTLAREVYDRISSKFEGACFIANVSERFIKREQVHLQEELLSKTLRQKICLSDEYNGIANIRSRLRHKKVLIILDDVDTREQLEMLAAEHEWFGPGSRIIITSRDEQILNSYVGCRIYKAEKLNDDEALMLFNKKAFKQDHPIENYRELSKRVVSYAKGLPLALKVIGTFLHGRGTIQWESAIDRLNKNPNKEILDVLQISFNGLEEFQKEIFLDIACFFKGMKEDQVTKILDACGFNASIGMKVLIERNLISVSQNELSMHDLLQKMGEEIVCRESPKNPAKRTRLWTYEDVSNALINSTGREEVESILILDLPKQTEATWNMDAFSKWSKLRLIKIHNVRLCQGPEYLSNELRFLEWHAFPSKALPVSFQPDDLVELDMSYSSIEQLWYGFKGLMNLKIINLSHSLNLTSTSDFTGTPNVERLILEGCRSLSEVHPSIGLHKKLEYVNLVDCASLRFLPSNLKMESLKLLTLNGCSRLDEFPKIVGNMSCLVTLHLDETAVEELPSSIQYFSGLVELSLKNCRSLERLPSYVCGLSSLEKLDLSGCSILQNLPEDLGKVECLKELDASGTKIQKLPESIFHLKNLEVLSFNGCRRIDLVCPSFSRLSSLTVLNLSDCNVSEVVLSENVGQLPALKSLDLSRNKFLKRLPRSINNLLRLETLNLEDCTMIQSLPLVPQYIQNVNFNGCTSLEEIPDPFFLAGKERSEFKCLNCRKLAAHNGCDNLGLTKLQKYLEGTLGKKALHHRPGFSIAVPGSKIPEWFIHQKVGSSINIEIPPKMDSDHSGWKGIAACVAFSALKDCEVPYLYCYFKTNGRENYPSNMWINRSFKVLSDHLWLFCLSFDHLTDWQHECVGNIELSFCSCEGGLKVKSCGVRLVHVQKKQQGSKKKKMVRPPDPFWAYAEEMNDGRKKCKFCEYIYARGTPITRVKGHLSGLRPYDARSCEMVPEDVKEAARAAMDGPPEKKLEPAASSSNTKADDSNKREEEENLLRIGETAILSTSFSFTTSNDNDSSSTTKEQMSNISPNGRFRRIITDWEKGKLLGRGAFGSVYEGISDDGFFFAVKEVSLLDDGRIAKQCIYQLEQEIALLSQFEHENIVQYYGTDKDESKHYIFLELVTKGSLLNLYQTYNLRDSQVSSYTRQILYGLKYLHDRNVVHRDIKCANILVDANGSVKLADFGLAEATKLNDVKSCKGTVLWMAPEVVNRKYQGSGLPADIWSLGCTVLEMLTRQYPYSDLKAMQALLNIGRGVRPLVPHTLSNDARDFILQCLQVNPNDRPTAAALLDHPFVNRPLSTSSGSASPYIGRRY